jgi:threonine/homoserine/homoserine lactone efflux protein
MFTAAMIGFVAGFVGSMPVAGPISILVFGRGLQDRPRSGVYVALGGALAESAYAYLAFWGFGELFAEHRWIEPISLGAGAVILTSLGVRFALQRTPPEALDQPPEQAVGNKRSFFLGLTITALNPTLMATWLAAVTLLRSFDFHDFGAGRALPFSVGVALGIFGWFGVLLMLLGRYKERFSRGTLDRTIRIMGIALVLFGLYFGVRFVRYLLAIH